MNLNRHLHLSALYLLFITVSVIGTGQKAKGQETFIPDLKTESIAIYSDSIYFPLFLQSLEDQKNQRFVMTDRYFRDNPSAGTSQRTVDISSVKLKVMPVYRHIYSAIDDYPVSFPVDWSDTVNPDLTWRLYFNSLRWLEAYLASRNPDSVFTAFRVIDDWICSHTSYPVVTEKYAFDDHGAAMRLDILGRAYKKYQSLNLDDRKFKQRLRLGMLTHIFYLASLEGYNCWHNHAIIFDENLIQTLAGLNDCVLREEILSLAYLRVAEQYRYSFTSEGVHKESSPCYHRQFTRTLGRLITSASSLGVQLPPSMIGLVDKAGNYQYYLDLQGPSLPIGDCARKPVNSIQSPKNVSENFKFRIFPQSGWAFVYDTLSRINIVTQSDFFSFSHYQKDETSFTITAGGNELILDPGLYSYKASPVQDYYRSARAHNVLVADSLPDVFDEKYTGLAGITRFDTSFDNNGRKNLALEMTHANYAPYKMKVKRQMLFPGSYEVVIRDIVTSRKKHEYSQLLHLGPNAVVTLSNGGFIIRWPHHDYFLVIRSDHDAFQLVRGETEPLQGWYFPAFDQMAEAPVLILKKSGRRCTMTCSISIGMPGSMPDTEKGYDQPVKPLIRKLEKSRSRKLTHQPYPARWKPAR